MTKTTQLSKSKLMAFKQCPKRLWLEVNRKDLKVESSEAVASFSIGHAIGTIARDIYDAEQRGTFLDYEKIKFHEFFSQTQELLEKRRPIFEAAFKSESAFALADVLLPLENNQSNQWHMIEVKSSTSVKDYHKQDSAIQFYIAKQSGLNLKSIALATIDNSFVYKGDNDYKGLLIETDLTENSISLEKDVTKWINEAHITLKSPAEPNIEVGSQCGIPFPCAFFDHCSKHLPKAEHPVEWLPRLGSSKFFKYMTDNNIIELKDAPDELLNETQLRVKKHTLANEVYFNVKAAALALKPLKLPALFLDFETINPSIPLWKDTRPYQQIPFQWSLHRLSRTRKLTHEGFLDLSGRDPSEAFATSLIEACGTKEPIFVYNAGFEKARISELAARFRELNSALLAINERIVDLLPIARKYYYHPSQQGSWSIKKLLPAIAPELSYATLTGVQDGTMAMQAYVEAIHPSTNELRKLEIHQQLEEYCKLDTLAMVKIWQYFSGK